MCKKDDYLLLLVINFLRYIAPIMKVATTSTAQTPMKKRSSCQLTLPDCKHFIRIKIHQTLSGFYCFRLIFLGKSDYNLFVIL